MVRIVVSVSIKYSLLLLHPPPTSSTHPSLILGGWTGVNCSISKYQVQPLTSPSSFYLLHPPLPSLCLAGMRRSTSLHLSFLFHHPAPTFTLLKLHDGWNGENCGVSKYQVQPLTSSNHPSLLLGRWSGENCGVSKYQVKPLTVPAEQSSGLIPSLFGFD